MIEALSPEGAVEFVREHGIVLESARGPAPSLAEAVAGAPIRGSWWSHPRSQAIFAATNLARESPDIAATRLLNGKVTLIHRRVWAPIVRLAPEIGPHLLAQILEEHTASGAHRATRIPFPDWVPAEALAVAQKLSEDEAWRQLQETLPAAVLSALGNSPRSSHVASAVAEVRRS